MEVETKIAVFLLLFKFTRIDKYNSFPAVILKEILHVVLQYHN